MKNPEPSDWQTSAGFRAHVAGLGESAYDEPMTDLTRQQVTDLLAASEAKVGERLANFDTSIKTGFAELRADMAKMNGEVHKGTADLIKWAVGLAISVVVMTVGLMTFINKSMDKPVAPQSAAPAPIIVTVPVPQISPAPAAAQAQAPATQSK